MKNSQKRKADAIEVLAALKADGIVSPSAVVRQEVMSLIVKQSDAVSPGGQKELITNATQIISGISDFENKALGKTIIVHGLRIRGNNSVYAGEGAVTIENADFATNAINIAVKNSDFSIVQGGKLFKAPVRALTSQANATSNSGDEFEFDKPITLTKDTPVSFVTNAPAGVALPTAGYLLIELSVSVVVEEGLRDLASKRTAC